MFDSTSGLLLILVILNGALAAYSTIRDRRRFRNAVFLLFFVLFLLAFIIRIMALSGNEMGALYLFGFIV